MKKSFQLIALAAIVLPLLIACNKKSTNEPENPNSFDSMDEWFDYWTTGDKKDALEVPSTAKIVRIKPRFRYFFVQIAPSVIFACSST